jgi:membrane protease YdiL (CAAX protease family)
VSTPRPFQATSALLLVGVQLVAAVGVLFLGALVSGGDSVGVVFLAAAPVVAPLVAVYVGLVRYAPEEGTAAALRLGKPDGWGLILLALLFGAALSPVVLSLQELLTRLVPSEPIAPELENELRAALEQPGTVLLLSLSTVIFAPLAHEALFRGLLQPRLMTAHGARRGFWITAFLYAATQLDARFLPLAFLVAVPLGVIARAAGTTWASVAAHVAMVAAPYLTAALGSPFVDLDGGASHVPLRLAAASAGLAATLLWLIWRRRIDRDAG